MKKTLSTLFLLLMLMNLNSLASWADCTCTVDGNDYLCDISSGDPGYVYFEASDCPEELTYGNGNQISGDFIIMDGCVVVNAGCDLDVPGDIVVADDSGTDDYYSTFVSSKLYDPIYGDLDYQFTEINVGGSIDMGYYSSIYLYGTDIYIAGQISNKSISTITSTFSFIDIRNSKVEFTDSQYDLSSLGSARIYPNSGTVDVTIDDTEITCTSGCYNHYGIYQQGGGNLKVTRSYIHGFSIPIYNNANGDVYIGSVNPGVLTAISNETGSTYGGFSNLISDFTYSGISIASKSDGTYKKIVIQNNIIKANYNGSVTVNNGMSVSAGTSSDDFKVVIADNKLTTDNTTGGTYSYGILTQNTDAATTIKNNTITAETGEKGYWVGVSIKHMSTKLRLLQNKISLNNHINGSIGVYIEHTNDTLIMWNEITKYRTGIYWDLYHEAVGQDPAVAYGGLVMIGNNITNDYTSPDPVGIHFVGGGISGVHGSWGFCNDITVRGTTSSTGLKFQPYNYALRDYFEFSQNDIHIPDQAGDAHNHLWLETPSIGGYVCSYYASDTNNMWYVRKNGSVGTGDWEDPFMANCGNCCQDVAINHGGDWDMSELGFCPSPDYVPYGY